MKTQLRDAAGRIIPTDPCSCGRPKEAAKAHCCEGCARPHLGMDAVHSNACNIRCATLGVPGFGFRMTEVREDPPDRYGRTTLARADGSGRQFVIRKFSLSRTDADRERRVKLRASINAEEQL